MKNIAITLMGTTLLLTHIYASSSCIDKGKLLYDEKIKAVCSISAYGLAEKHSQDEWEALQKKENIIKEIKVLCKTNATFDFNKDERFNLYNFLYEYANDGEGGGCGF